MTQEDYWAGVERLKARLWRLARLRLDSDADATDILDEAVFRGWQSCGQLRHPEYFDTWLTRILINACHHELRRRRRLAVRAQRLRLLRLRPGPQMRRLCKGVQPGVLRPPEVKGKRPGATRFLCRGGQSVVY